MKVSALPIFVIAGFNLFTFFMYLISPYVDGQHSAFMLSAFVLINIAAIVLGYARGESVARRVVSKGRRGDAFPVEKIFLFLSVFYSLTFIIKYAYLLKFEVYDVDGMIRHLLIGVANPKLGYLLSVDETRLSTVSWSLFFLISIFNGIYFVAGFILWKGLSSRHKSVFVFFLLVEMFYWLGRGTNFGVVSLILIFLLASIVDGKGRLNLANSAKYAVLLLAGLASFSVTMYSRSEGAVYDLQVFALPWNEVDEGSILFEVVPQALHTSMMTIFYYLVQGYYNTAVAFDLEFMSSWMGGWNPAIQSLYAAFGFDVSDQTYIQRLDAFGIDPRVNWHSAYTWFANDVSFYGVPFIMFILGYLIGFSWVKAVVIENDLFSKIVFILLSASALFNFANTNFIAYYFYSLMFIFPYWLVRNRAFSR